LIPLTAVGEGPGESAAEGGSAKAVAEARVQVDTTKRCPACGEQILAIARKCKHCGEYLDREQAVPGEAATPLQPDSADPVFDLSVSQWDNFWKYLILLTVFLVIAAALIFIEPLKVYAAVGVTGSFVLLAFIAWFFYLSVRNSRCIIKASRIETEVGIFAKSIDTLEIYRITDLELRQGIVQRVLGIGTVAIKSNDPSNPELLLYQIPRARKVYKYLQDQIPQAQKQRGIMFVQK